LSVTLKLYPVPTTLSLKIQRRSAAFFADMQVLSGDKIVKEAKDLPLRVTRSQLSFVFPAGPNGTTIDMRAIRTATTLRGTATFASADRTLEGEGSWVVRRAKSPNAR
jgi:hypothetical protein